MALVDDEPTHRRADPARLFRALIPCFLFLFGAAKEGQKTTWATESVLCERIKDDASLCSRAVELNCM